MTDPDVGVSSAVPPGGDEKTMDPPRRTGGRARGSMGLRGSVGIAPSVHNDSELEVIVIEDHLSMRKGVELLLRANGLRVVGVASHVDEARSLLARRRYDAALIDVHLGTQRSVSLVGELLRADPDAAVVLYTGYTDPGGGLNDAVRAGARGFVLKASPPPRLVHALRVVAAGGTYVDPDIAALLLRDEGRSQLPRLSPREYEILGLLAEGITGQAIAEQLFLSPETVRTHVRNATTKLGARTRVQAVAMMVRAHQV